MNKARPLALRGLTVQLLGITVLPLTILLLLIAFGSVSLHQQDMRALVGERDQRAVQAASSELASEIHHRVASISYLASLVSVSGDLHSISTKDLETDFDGGLAFLDKDGNAILTTGQAGPWQQLQQNKMQLSLSSDLEPIVSEPFRDANSNQYFVIISQIIPSKNMIVAGAFSPQNLAHEILSASFPNNKQVSIFLLDKSGRLLFSSGPLMTDDIPIDHPGVGDALHGKSGTVFVSQDNSEHVIAYSPIAQTGWAMVIEENWQMVVSPSLQLTQMAPLFIAPAFILALIALWFVVTRIVRPLQTLETKTAALAWGDFEAIKDPVGGISEVQHLQKELIEMSRKVKAAQEGLHDYIGAITTAQEEERLRLARELHDDTIQSVIALKQRVQLAQKSVRDQASRNTLSELEILSEQTIENLRRMTRALRPIYLEDLGLVTALEMLVRETNQNNSPQIDFHKSGSELRLSREIELALYRISQEAISNIVRHSKAKHGELKILFKNTGVELEISDDGIGFQAPTSPTDFAPSGHFGLLGIHERADLIGAKMEIECAPGNGTKLKVKL